VRFLRIGATVLLAPLIAWTAPWQDGLTADVLGPTPEVRPFQAEFRFGWSEIEAAHVSTNIRYEGGDVFMDATGSTTGMARLLMGSVAEAIVRRAPCPVLVYREAAERLAHRGQPVGT
jgi:hypothetical protein